MKSVLLVILDGWGIAPPWGGNVISAAQVTNFDNFWRKYPHSILQASGEAVGLPGHERGNSEVGHMNIGAGRIIKQGVVKINESIKSGKFFKNQAIIEAFQKTKEKKGKLHFIGVVSDGGIHSHLDHLFALIDFAVKENVPDFTVHAITDGRDASPLSGILYLGKLEKKLKEVGRGKIATVMGRYYAMDRDNRWERTRLAYDALVLGEGNKAESALKGISGAYGRGETDEFIRPIVVEKSAQGGGRPLAKIEANDSVILFNFRADRVRQISLALLKEDFNFFERKIFPKDLFFVSFIPYGGIQDLGIPVKNAFEPELLSQTLSEIISQAKLKQFHIAETEKYAHITFFFDGGRREAFEGEERILVPSPRVASYDLKPEMSAHEVAEKTLEAIKKKKYGFIVVNFANPDMVGHTGNFNAAVKAAETVDEELRRIVSENQRLLNFTLVTSDHGNIEQMINPRTGQPDTEHTKNPVPFIFIPPEYETLLRVKPIGVIGQVAPTVLKLLDISQPKEMTLEPLL